MKNLLKKMFVIGIILSSILSINSMANQTPAFAKDDNDIENCRYFMGLQSWDCHLPPDINTENEAELTTAIWTIAANILIDLTIIAAYLVVGYVIYGGYQYMFSQNDPNKVINARQTLTRAFIGLAIVLLSNVIITSLSFALLGNGGGFAQHCLADDTACLNDNPYQVIVNAIQWVIAISGLVALIFVVIGGIGYVTSSGDVNKLNKAKGTLINALIGLAIVGLSEVIVIFVSNVILNNS